MQSLREPLVLSHHLKQLLQGTWSLLQYPIPALLPLSLSGCHWQCFVISLVFSALISILYRVQVLSRISTRASSSCSSSARASMSSANRRLVIFLPPMLTFPSCSSRASDMIRSRKMLKRMGDRRHPCLTPTVVLNHSHMLPFIWTALVALSYSCSMVWTRFELIIYFRMVAHKAACHTLSNAFLKSMKTWYRFCWCWRYFSHRILRLKICSVVLLPPLNPACSSAIISSAWALRVGRKLPRNWLN